jgi:acetolactate synthase-1/2/3 large subunit
MEFQVPKENMVFPMVPAGAATGDMITEMFNKDEMAKGD